MQEEHQDQPPDRFVFPEPPIPTLVKAEAGVRNWYSKRADTWCRIAAALGLRSGNWDWSMLRYTTDLMPCTVDDGSASGDRRTRTGAMAPLGLEDEAIWIVSIVVLCLCHNG
jgi:hypothetical protein